MSHHRRASKAPFQGTTIFQYREQDVPVYLASHTPCVYGESMGGLGSGRWQTATHGVVERCPSVSIKDVPPLFRPGPLTLTCTVHGKPLTLRVSTDFTPSVWGKHKKWWFLCPLCRRRCEFLYLPLGGDQFACRLCWNLAYRSQGRHYPPSQRRLRQALAVLAHERRVFP